MSFTIGRATLDTHPYAIVQDGDSVTFGIDIAPGTVAEAKALRQQLAGLSRGEVVPITNSDDSDMDGFYTVIGTQVAPVTQYLNTGFMRAAVSVRRVGGGYANAVTEIVSSSWDLALDEATGSGSRWAQSNVVLGATNKPTVRRQTATGDVWRADGDVRPLVAPDDWYNGACLIEYLDGGVWYPLQGRQLPGDVPIRIGNGLVRGTWDASTSAAFDLEVFEGITDDAWQDVDSFTVFSSGNPAGSVQRLRPTVIRNDPETVVVRWVFEYEALLFVRTATLEMSLTRGWYSFTTRFNGGFNVRVAASTAHDPTEVQINSVDRGYRATAATADGHKWLLATFDGTIPLGGDIELGLGDSAIIAVEAESATGVLEDIRYAISLRQRVIT